MAQRLELQEILETLLGSRNVYFQPPPSVLMKYPCIRYERESIAIDHADNKPYKHVKRYLITVIDPNPDSTIPDQVAKLESCAFDRHYTADNLNHDVFRILF